MRRTQPFFLCRSAFLRPAGTICSAALVLAFLAPARAQDPIFTSWRTMNSAQHAKVREQAGSNLVTTWPATGLPNNGGGQATPAYSDVQQIRYSANFVYVNSNNLASHTMGPWYNNTSKTALFGFWPAGMNYQVRIPRNPAPAVTRTTLGLGDVGVLVNGVAVFNYLDALSYRNADNSERPGNGPVPGDGIWNRLAYPIEGVTFDPAQLHQPGNGQYHSHSNPYGLRYQLGDNVSYDAVTDTYSENTSSLHHSPILGWAFDGYPIYGPYGYSHPMEAGSGVRRMRTGYVLRDGSNGTVDLAATGRHTIPAWAAAAHKPFTTSLTATQYGPNVSVTYFLGRYAEDYDHLGDLGVNQGTSYDLDRCNGRQCVTPDFPGGTYAYFVTIDGTGKPEFPNLIGAQYYGTPSGGRANTIAEPVTTWYVNNGQSRVEAWKEY